MKNSRGGTRLTTRDSVAARAGVSSATVSRVYNNPSSVSSEKRRAVLEAAEALGYYPNKAASALRRDGSGIITLAEFKKDDRDYYWADLSLFKWFFADVVHAVRDVVEPTMFQLNLAVIKSPSDLESLKGRTDGLICFDVDRESEAEMISRSSIPYVIGHHTAAFASHLSCSTDNFHGGGLQAQLLIERGSRRPAYISAHIDDVAPNRERYLGFRAAFGKTDVRLIETSVSSEAGRIAAESLMPDIKAGRIDGIAAVNDITAAGAAAALEAAGVRVQKDIPLAGYDAMPFAAALPFKLLSVDLRPAAIYREAALSMLEYLSGNRSLKSKIIKPVV